MNRKVLCVDDDANVLAAYRRQLRKQFDIETAEGGQSGLEAMASRGPFAVVVADMRMPNMDGIQFLTQVRQRQPETVRMMLSGNADMQTAIDAVNEGAVFRFLCKPCSPEDLAKSLEAGVEQYRLVTAEKRLLQDTLAGVMKVVGDLIALANPIAFGRASRAREIMSKIASKLDGASRWEFEVAGMLSQIGCLILPPGVLDKVHRGKPLSPEEAAVFETHPQIGRDLVKHIPRFERIAEIIGYQEIRTDPNGAPLDSQEEKMLPLGARALHVALDFDTLVKSGKSEADALKEIKRTNDWYDAQVVAALEAAVLGDFVYEERELAIDQLAPGMVLADDVRTSSGSRFENTCGQEVTPSLIAWMRNFPPPMKIVEPLKVRVPQARVREADLVDAEAVAASPG